MIDRTKWKIILLPAEQCLILQRFGSFEPRAGRGLESDSAADSLCEQIVLDSKVSAADLFLKHQERFLPWSEVGRSLELGGRFFLSEVECYLGTVLIKNGRVSSFIVYVSDPIRVRRELFDSITAQMGVNHQEPSRKQKLLAKIGFGPDLFGIWEANGTQVSVGLGREPEELWLYVQL